MRYDDRDETPGKRAVDSGHRNARFRTAFSGNPDLYGIRRNLAGGLPGKALQRYYRCGEKNWNIRNHTVEHAALLVAEGFYHIKDTGPI